MLPEKRKRISVGGVKVTGMLSIRFPGTYLQVIGNTRNVVEIHIKCAIFLWKRLPVLERHSSFLLVGNESYA